MLDVNNDYKDIMVGVAQLVEPWIVIPVVVGSSPIIHPSLIFTLLVITFLSLYLSDKLIIGSITHYPCYISCQSHDFCKQC